MTNEKTIEWLESIKKKYIRGGDEEFDAKRIEAINNAIKALESQRWIPVSERLPEESGEYLVTTKWKGSYSGAVYIETNMAEYRKKPKEWDCVDVIAWMPLPQRYKECDKE